MKPSRNRSSSHSRKVGTKTIEVNTDANSNSKLDVVNRFWLRTDILQHGILPIPGECELNFASLSQLCDKHHNARVLSREYFKTINYEHPSDGTLTFQEWKAIASDDLKLSETQIEILFERFKTIRSIREGRWRKTETYTGVVYFYEFILFLALQSIFAHVRTNLSKSFPDDNNEIPTSARIVESNPLPTTRSKRGERVERGREEKRKTDHEEPEEVINLDGDSSTRNSDSIQVSLKKDKESTSTQEEEDDSSSNLGGDDKNRNRNVSLDKISSGKQSISKFKFQRKNSVNSSTKENENSPSQTNSSNSSKSNVTTINIPSNNAISDDGVKTAWTEGSLSSRDKRKQQSSSTPTINSSPPQNGNILKSRQSVQKLTNLNLSHALGPKETTREEIQLSIVKENLKDLLALLCKYRDKDKILNNVENNNNNSNNNINNNLNNPLIAVTNGSLNRVQSARARAVLENNIEISGEMISPSQLDYFSFIIGASTEETSEFSIENWSSLLPLTTHTNMYLLDDVVKYIASNLTLNNYSGYISGLTHLNEIKTPPLTNRKKKEREKEREEKNLILSQAVLLSQKKPLVISHVHGEMILKSDINSISDSHTTRDQNNPPIIINAKKSSNNKNETKKFVNSSNSNSSSSGMAKSSSGNSNNNFNYNSAFHTNNNRNNMSSSQMGSSAKIANDKAVSSLKSGESISMSSESREKKSYNDNSSSSIGDDDSIELENPNVVRESSSNLPARSHSHAEVHVQQVSINDAKNSYIYILLQMGNVSINSCRGSTIVLGVVGGIISIENCSHCNIIAVTHSIQIGYCVNVQFNIHSDLPPILVGFNSNLIFGPYNTSYSSLERHIENTGIVLGSNNWRYPILFSLTMLRHVETQLKMLENELKNTKSKSLSDTNVDYFDVMMDEELNNHSLLYRNKEIEDAEAKLKSFTKSRFISFDEDFLNGTFKIQEPKSYNPFAIPVELTGNTTENPIELPEEYKLALVEKSSLFSKLSERLAALHPQESKVIQKQIQEQFQMWLIESGNYHHVRGLVAHQYHNGEY